jgi:hypothetical protein
MKPSETARILAVISTAYPEKFKVDDLKVQLWHNLLKDIPYEVANIAIQKHILESPFVPTIADIRKAATDIVTPEEQKIDAATAWGEVTKAISSYGIYRPDEAMASMSPATAKVVKFISWQEICLSENQGVVRGQFMKMFDSVTQRESKDKLLPSAMKNQITQISDSMRMLDTAKSDLVGMDLERQREVALLQLVESEIAAAKENMGR